MKSPCASHSPVAAVLLSVVLAACAATEPTSPQAAAAADAAAARPAPSSRDTFTGSRIPRDGTDRLVHKIGNAGAKEMERDRTPNPGIRGN